MNKIKIFQVFKYLKMLLTLPLEIIFKIFHHLSITDLLILSKTCREFNRLSTDENLWKKLVSRDFKIKIREEDTWREEYRYLFKEDVRLQLITAIEKGDLNLVKYCLYLGAEGYIDKLIRAAKKGYLEIFRTLRDVICDNCISIGYNEVVAAAAEYGHIYILKEIALFQNLRECSIAILSGAAKGGHIEIIRFMRKTTGYLSVSLEYNSIIVEAVKAGRRDFIIEILSNENEWPKSLRSNYAKALEYSLLYGRSQTSEKQHLELNYKDLISDAVSSGNFQIVFSILKTMKQMEIEIDFPNLILIAVRSGHVVIFCELVKEFGEENITNKSSLFSNATRYGKIEMVKLLLKMDYYKDDLSLKFAIERRYLEIVKILLENRKVDVDYHKAIKTSIDNRSISILKLLLKRVKNPDYLLYLEEAKCAWSSEITLFLVNHLIKKNLEFPVSDYILYEFLGKKDLNDLRYLINLAKEQKVEINYKELLRLAVQTRSSEIVKYISDNISNYQATLCTAAEKGSLKMVKLILILMKEKNIVPNYYEALDKTIIGKQEHIFKYLIEIVRKGCFSVDYLTLLKRLNPSNLEIVRILFQGIEEDEVRLAWLELDCNEFLKHIIYHSNCQILRMFRDMAIRHNFDIDRRKAKKVLQAASCQHHPSYRDYSRMTRILNDWLK